MTLFVYTNIEQLTHNTARLYHRNFKQTILKIHESPVDFTIIDNRTCYSFRKKKSQIRIRDRSLNMGGGGGLEDFQGGPPIFSQASKGGAAQFFARTVGGATYFSQENLKIECTIDQINCNINRQIISSNSYLKKFSGPPIMFLVFHVCSHFRRHLFHSFNLICYDHFSEWMNEA